MKMGATVFSSVTHLYSNILYDKNKGCIHYLWPFAYIIFGPLTHSLLPYLCLVRTTFGDCVHVLEMVGLLWYFSLIITFFITKDTLGAVIELVQITNLLLARSVWNIQPSTKLMLNSSTDKIVILNSILLFC